MVDSMRKWFPAATDVRMPHARSTASPASRKSLLTFSPLRVDCTQAEIVAMATQFEADLLQVAKEQVERGEPGIVILPGVERILSELRSHPKAEEHYAICTSGEKDLL